MTKIILIGTFLLLGSSISTAGTIIKIKEEKEINTILTDGKQARMNMGGDDYVLLNYKDSSMKVIDTKKHQVMLFDVDNMPKMGKAPKIHISIKNIGSGPVIAGYKTQKFSYAVKGKACGVVYGSTAAYQHKSVKKLFDAMQMMMKKQQAMMGGFAGMVDDCMMADIGMSEHVSTIGVPMRVEEKGAADTEVKSIQLDVALPADTFVIPASYKTVTISSQMQKMQKDMSKMQQQHNPQMQQMLQQMQKSNNMPPEVMEQIRRAQEQMKQYQQPSY